MQRSSASQRDDFLLNLVHDLRQPLSIIQLSTFHLHLLLGEPRGKAHEQLRTIEQQTERVSRILCDAVAELGRLHDQWSAAESLPLTNSATAGVT